MSAKLHYGSMTEAISKLRKEGYKIDYTIEEDHLTCADGRVHITEFEIMDIYRYEGDSDPGDESVVYAVRSKSGQKGIIVGGYGSSSDHQPLETLLQLRKAK